MPFSTRVRSWIRSHVLALVALFVALSGAAAVAAPSVHRAQPPPNNSVGAKQIKDDAIRAEHIAAGVIDVSHITPGGLTAEAFASSVAEKLLNEATVETHHIVDEAVTRAKLADNAVGTFEVENNSLTSADILDGSITGVDIAAGSITIADNSVTLAKMADNSVSSAEIVNGSVTMPDLASLAVANANLAADAITTDKVLNGTLTAADIGNAASGSDDVNADLLDGLSSNAFQSRVTGTCPASTAVRTIGADGSVTCEPVTGGTGGAIADGSVTTPKLADGAVTSVKMAANAVGSAQIANNAVGPSDLANPPSVSVSGVQGSTGLASFNTEVFNNGNLFTFATPTRITIAQTGLYQVDVSYDLNTGGRAPNLTANVLRTPSGGSAAPLPELEVKTPIDQTGGQTYHSAALVRLFAGDFLTFGNQFIDDDASVETRVQLYFVTDL